MKIFINDETGLSTLDYIFTSKTKYLILNVVGFKVKVIEKYSTLPC